MKKLAILVHGFNVRDGGRDTVGTLRDYFTVRGYDVVIVRYGLFGFVRIYAKNNKVAKQVAEIAENAKLKGYHVVALGHSNGCDILHRAKTNFKAPIDFLSFINPALEKGIFPGAQADVWFNEDDTPVKFAKFLPKHPWGEMGATGYRGKVSMVNNHNCKKDYPVVVSGHSDIFAPEKVCFYGPTIAESCDHNLNNLIDKELSWLSD